MACPWSLRIDSWIGSMEELGTATWVGKEVWLEWIQEKFRGEEIEASIGNSFKELCSKDMYRNGVIGGEKNRVKESVWMKTGKRKVLTCELEVS